jgi:hypothetical protein
MAVPERGSRGLRLDCAATAFIAGEAGRLPPRELSSLPVLHRIYHPGRAYCDRGGGSRPSSARVLATETAPGLTPNQRIEPTTRSAITLLSQSSAVDALLVMAHPYRSAYEFMRIRLPAFISMALLSFASMVGCSRKPAEPPGAAVPSDAKVTATARQNAGPSGEEAKKAALDNNDGPIDAFFNENRGLSLPEDFDALVWVKRNPKAFPGGATLEAMLTSLSDAGAQRINVFTNWPFCDYLIFVTLPSEAATRQKVFASDSRLREVCGMEKAKDFGQKYLVYPFRRSMFKPKTTN